MYVPSSAFWYLVASSVHDVSPVLSLFAPRHTTDIVMNLVWCRACQRGRPACLLRAVARTGRMFALFAFKQKRNHQAVRPLRFPLGLLWRAHPGSALPLFPHERR